MTELERLAKAAGDEMARQATDDCDYCVWPTDSQGEIQFDGSLDLNNVVRAILKEFREPSDAMVKAARARQLVVSGDEPSVVGVRSCWRAMIDALVTE